MKTKIKTRFQRMSLTCQIADLMAGIDNDDIKRGCKAIRLILSAPIEIVNADLPSLVPELEHLIREVANDRIVFDNCLRCGKQRKEHLDPAVCRYIAPGGKQEVNR